MKKNQRQRILEYMTEFGSITALEAFRDLGVSQLSARLVEIEKDGICFNKQQESALNRFGERVYYTRYSIAKQEGQDNG